MRERSRRDFLKVAAGGGAALLVPSIGLRAEDKKSRMGDILREAPALYTTVGTISGEWKTVRYFYSFTCPMSKTFHSSIYKWGLSLPKDIKFLPTPVFGKGDDTAYPAALVFYGLWLTQPEKLGQFIETAYQVIGDGVMDPTDSRSYMHIARATGARVNVIAEKVMDGSADRMIKEAMTVGHRFGLKSTPSIGVGGRFLTTPDGVAGRMDLFIQLLNGLTSKMILGHK